MSKLRDAAQQALEALVQIHPGNMTPMAEEAWNKAIVMLGDALAEQPAEQEPVAWEWRWFDTSPYTVTSGQWSEWKRVEPRNSLCTLDDALNEFRAYIANGLRYELRAIYTAPQPAIPPGWATAYAAFKGAFDTPLARRRDSGEYAQDARRLLREFNDAMLAAPEAPQPAKQPLIADEICDSWEFITGHQIQFGPSSEGRPMYLSTDEVIEFARAIERAHGIGDQE